MFNGSNCDRKSQRSGILTEPLNPRGIGYLNTFYHHIKFLRRVFLIANQLKLS